MSTPKIEKFIIFVDIITLLAYYIKEGGDFVKDDISQEMKNIFSENLRELLKANHKKQSDIVNDLHIPASTVSDWVTGKKYPRVDKMQALADYFGVKKSDLQEKKEASSKKENAYEKEILEVFRTVSPAKQKKVIAQLRLELEEQRSES